MKPIVIYLVIGAVILLLICVGLVWKGAQKPAGISEAEKAKIDAWIIENDLSIWRPKRYFLFRRNSSF